MTLSAWRRLRTEQQREFLKQLQTKLDFYESLIGDRSRWHSPYEQADPSEYVTPVDASQLP